MDRDEFRKRVDAAARAMHAYEARALLDAWEAVPETMRSVEAVLFAETGLRINWRAWQRLARFAVDNLENWCDEDVQEVRESDPGGAEVHHP